MECDLCVVGAGMFGSAAARHASSNPTLKVVLIGPDEPDIQDYKRKEVYSCHYDEGRITRILDENFVYEALSKQSISRYKELESISGISFYTPVGCLMMGQEDSDILIKLSKEAASKDYSHLHLSEEQLKIRYPYLKLKSGEVAILDENGAGYISARGIVEAQKTVARLQGCLLIDDLVVEVRPLSETDRGLYHEVVTSKGQRIFARRVLVCAGAFTKYKPLVPHPKNWTLKCRTNEETVVLMKVSPQQANDFSSMPSIIYHTTEFTEEGLAINSYILPPIQYPDGNYYIKIGHIDDSGKELRTLYDVQTWYCSKGDSQTVEKHAKLLENFIPKLEVLSTDSRTCVCCYTPHDNPYIDRVTPTLCVAFGGNGKGAKVSDEVGRLAAELCVYGKWDSDIPKSQFQVFWNKLSAM